MAGLVATLLVPARLGAPLRAVAGWDTAAVVLGIMCWLIILRSDTGGTRRHAAMDDPGRRAAWAMVTLTSGFSLFANAVLLRGARGSAPAIRGLFVALCAVAVGSAWLLTHTAYTFRYAHLYYRDDAGEGGLDFPGRGQPAFVDFAYFAFTIGMCFQVSDVPITSRRIRRAVLGHCLLAFAYNTAILATAVNLVVTVFG